MLEAVAERRREARGPRSVDKADADEIADVGAVLVAPGDELHPEEGFEARNLEIIAPLGVFDFRQGVLVVRIHLLAREQQMDAAARLSVGPIDERIDAPNMVNR